MSKSYFKALSLSALAAAMTGCVAVSNGAEQALSIEEEHPISVDSQTVTMTIDLADTAGDLTSIDKARLRAFAGAYLNDRRLRIAGRAEMRDALFAKVAPQEDDRGQALDETTEHAVMLPLSCAESRT